MLPEFFNRPFVTSMALLFVVLGLASCNKDCEDCGPYTSNAYSIENTTNEKLDLVFFRNGGEQESIEVQQGTQLLVFELSVVAQDGELHVAPFEYDSVALVYSGIETYQFDRMSSCDSTINPLCEENYELIHSETTKDGSTFREYQLVID